MAGLKQRTALTVNPNSIFEIISSFERSINAMESADYIDCQKKASMLIPLKWIRSNILESPNIQL